MERKGGWGGPWALAMGVLPGLWELEQLLWGPGGTARGRLG